MPSCTTLRRRELSEFSFTIRLCYNFSGLCFGLRLPPFFWVAITCGNLTVGHFRLQLRVAVLQWAGAAFRTEAPSSSVYKCMQPHGFFLVECPGSRGNLPKNCFGEPTQRPLTGLTDHLMKAPVAFC